MTIVMGQTTSVDNSPIVNSNYANYGGSALQGSLLVQNGVFATYFNADPGVTPNPVNAACNQYFGYNCGSGQAQSTAYDCGLANLQRSCTTSQQCNRGRCNQVTTCSYSQSPQYLFTSSTGVVPTTGSDLTGLNSPTFVIGSPTGQVIVADTGNNRVLSIDPSTSNVTIIAGNGQNIYSGDGGAAINAGLFHPRGLVYDWNGNLYVSTEDGYIRMIDTSGNISTYAGLALPSGGQVMAQGPANAMFFNIPQGMVIDSTNQYLYVADSANNRVVQINMQTGIANQIAGTNTCTPGTSGSTMGDGGAALNASICYPTTLGLDNQNNLLIVDSGHQAIRRVTFKGPTAGVLAYAPSASDLSRLFKNADGSWTRQYRNGNYDYFDVNGYQSQSTDRVGRITRFTYDSNKNLSQITFPNNQSLNYNYSGSQLSSIVDPAGRSTTFSYSGGNLTSVHFADGTSRSFQYDSNGQMIHETDQRGNTTQYSYNAWNRLNQVTRADGTTQIINDIASQTVANNYTGGNTGSMQSIGFDSGESSTQVTNANNVTTKMTTDYMGFISQIQDALGNTTTITRDLQGRPLTITKPDGTMTTMSYDQTTGDLLSTTDNTLNITISRTYDTYGNVVTQADGNYNAGEAGDRVMANAYDPNTGLLLQTTYPNGNVVAYTYNSSGLFLQKIVQNGQSSILTTYSYDSYGNVNQEAVNNVNPVSFANDLAGNVLQSISTSTGSDQLITSYTYDAFNRLRSVTSPKNEVTSYSYLGTGQISTILDPRGKTASFSYDQLGRLISKTDTLGMNYSFAYDGNSNRISETDPNGNNKTYSYDVLNRMTQAILPDDTVTYTYNLRNDVISVTNNVSEVDSFTDTQKRVTFAQTTGLGSMANYPSVGMTYSYDQDGNRTKISTNYGNISYAYDYDSRLTGISNTWGDQFGFNYDVAGRLTQISRPGSSTSYSYSTAGTIMQIAHNMTSGQSDYENLAYDQRNFPITRSTASASYTYNYDNDGQLVGATDSTQSSESFTYDGLGNRLTDAQAHAYGYDSNGQRLLDDGVYTYIYDNNGNMLSKLNKDSLQVGYKFSYNSKNQLIQTQVLASTFGSVTKQINYVYDAVGRRMQKSVTDTVSAQSYTRNFIYDGQDIMFEFDGSSNLLTQYTHNPSRMDDVLSVNVTAAGVTAKRALVARTYYFLKDHLGNITSITDGSGNILQKYDYSAFGKILTIKDASGNDVSQNQPLHTALTYTGREYEEDTGLFFYRARFYDPSIGRFLQTDPDPGNLKNPISMISKYVYAKNNPLYYTDPTGKEFALVGGDTDPSDVHGYYCGYSAHGQQRYPFDPSSNQQLPPQDSLDATCAYHDQAYASINDIEAFNEAPKRFEADLKLLGAGLQEIGSNPGTGIAITIGATLFLTAEELIIIPFDIVRGLASIIGIHF